MTAVDDGLMTSCLTPHTARRVAVRPGEREFWRVTWLPFRVLARNQAVTAMTIAELCDHLAGDQDAALLEELCRELGVGWLDAMGRCYTPPHTLDTRFHQLSTSCWCQPATAWDGHRNDDEIDVDFEAMFGDPIDAAGFPL